MIRAIFFDFDGVLVDSEPLHYACWMEALEGQGIRITPEEYARRFTGVSDTSMVGLLCREFGRPGDEVIFAECKERKRALYRERAPMTCRIPGDLLTLIATSSDVYSIGVVSSSNRLDVEPHLVAHGIRDSLATLVCCEDVPRLKPAPDPYLQALRSLGGVSKGELNAHDCLVVEDSDAGIEAGLAAGMRVVRVPGPEAVASIVRSALAGNWPGVTVG